MTQDLIELHNKIFLINEWGIFESSTQVIMNQILVYICLKYFTGWVHVFILHDYVGSPRKTGQMCIWLLNMGRINSHLNQVVKTSQQAAFDIS